MQRNHLGLCAGAVLLALACVSAAARGAVAKPSPDLGYRVYVTDEGSGDVTVIDGLSRQVVATIALGKRPRGIVADPRNHRLFVALSGSPLAGPGVDENALPPADKGADGIAVIDLATLRIDKVLRGISDPEQVAVSGDGRRLYVASEDTGKGAAIEIKTGIVLAEFAVGAEPEGIAAHPRRDIVYLTSEGLNSVAVVDTTTLQILRTVSVGQRPRDVAVSADGSRVYVTGENDATLTVLDGRSDEIVTTLRVPGDGARPKGVVVSHDGARVYVSTGRGGEIVAFDATTLTALGSVKVGSRPWGLALSPDGQYLYAAKGPSDDVSVVATSPLRVVATIGVGKRPWGVAIAPHVPGK